LVHAALRTLPCVAAAAARVLLPPPPAGDFMRDFSLKLVPLLEDKIRVMIYAGGRSMAQALHCIL
jgi:hypothetical protein